MRRLFVGGGGTLGEGRIATEKSFTMARVKTRNLGGGKKAARKEVCL